MQTGCSWQNTWSTARWEWEWVSAFANVAAVAGAEVVMMGCIIIVPD